MMSRDGMKDEMCMLVAGRVAEKIVGGGVPCTGALNDFERMTKMAYAMVSYYGMSDKVGNLSYYNSNGGGYDLTKPYSEKTAELIDAEAKALTDEATRRAEQILSDNWSGVVELAEMLIEKEIIMAEDIEKIFGPKAGKHGEERLKDSSSAPESAADRTASEHQESESPKAGDTAGSAQGAGSASNDSSETDDSDE